MKELSLHILDITQNSVRAGAKLVTLDIDENHTLDTLSISIADDGCGIPADMLKDIANPFVTSRTTRKVGMGISLFKDAAETAGGSFVISSEVGIGTTVKAVFQHSHIDREPLGDMADSVVTMILSFGSTELLYHHWIDGQSFKLDTREIKSILEEDCLMNDPEILNWIHGYVAEGLAELTATDRIDEE